MTDKWGPWRLTPEGRYLLYLVNPDLGYEYDIDLLKCKTSEEALWWMRHISEKNWATDEVMAGLARALCVLVRKEKSNG
jgi:hypothetical protein